MKKEFLINGRPAIAEEIDLFSLKLGYKGMVMLREEDEKGQKFYAYYKNWEELEEYMKSWEEKVEGYYPKN